MTSKLRTIAQYSAIFLVSFIAAVLLAELYLASRPASRLTLPFYNRLYPYVMFRPHENTTYISADKSPMSHHTSQVFHYTNGDGFRIASADYELPKQKPAGQVRIAVLGGSAVQLGSTFETTLPGSLKTFFRKKYPEKDIEVINAAIQSCVSRQSIAHLVFTVVGYEPDIVILYDGVNDIGLPLTYESRANFPYNFHVMETAWESYREEHQKPLLDLLLDRSYLVAALRPRFHGDKAPDGASATVKGLHVGPTAIPAERVVEDTAFARNHISAYLSNWRKLVELSAAYDFEPVCILQPTAGLEREYALPLTMSEFGLDEKTASNWIAAFAALYEEADRQIEELRRDYPSAAFINLRSYLKPAQEHFWDLVHVYDETNMVLAERIYRDLEPVLTKRLGRVN